MNKLRIKGKKFLIIFAALTGVLIVASLIAGSVYSGDLEYRLRTKKINRILSEKEKLTAECLTSLRDRLDNGQDSGSVQKDDLFSIAGKEGITFLEYVDDKLVYWSDNSFDIPVVYDDSLFAKPLAFIHNGWFITKSLQAGNEKIIAMLRIRNDFGFENDIVRNGFVGVFDIPEGTGISFDREPSGFEVTDSQGKWLFSLVYPERKEPSYYIILPVFLWIISLLMLVILVERIAAFLTEKGKRYFSAILSLILLGALYAVVFITGKPEYFL